MINGEFPITLKNAYVIPVHKKDDPTDKTNFRPVSVSPLLSKVFEQVTSRQFKSFDFGNGSRMSDENLVILEF